jgi:hypothetical protein
LYVGGQEARFSLLASLSKYGENAKKGKLGGSAWSTANLRVDNFNEENFPVKIRMAGTSVWFM